MQFTVPNEMTVSVRKTAHVIEGIADWPLVSIEKIFAYGLQQLSNDAVASAENDDEIVALFQKRIDNLAAGVLRASPIRVGDPVAREAMRIAREMVLAALKKKGVPAKGQPVAELATKLIAKNPAITAQAEANVAAVGELDVDVDLD